MNDGGPEMARMEPKALRGMSWTFLSYVATRTVSLATTIALARLLTPRDFGLVALALVVVNLLAMLNDMGAGAALVVRADLDRAATGTALTLMVGTSLVLAGALVAVAPVIADLMDAPGLTSVLLVMSGVVVLGGPVWFYESLLQRQLEFRRRFVARSAEVLAYAGTALLAAALGAGVWSLVVGQLAGTAVKLAVLAWVAEERVRPSFHPKIAGELVRSGWGFAAQGMLGYARDNVDYIVIGRVVGSAGVGQYSMGYRLGDVTFSGITEPVVSVTFPAFARMRARGENVGFEYLRVLRAVALVACPVGILMSATADPFTRAVFGEPWIPMIGPLAVLGVWASVRPLQANVDTLLNSRGDAHLVARLTAILLAPFVAVVVLAAHAGGTTGVAWAVLGHMVVSTGLLIALVRRREGVGFVDHWRAIWPIAASCVACWLTARVVASAVSPPAASLALGLLAGGAVYLACVRMIAPGLLTSAREGLRGMFRSAPEPALR